MNIGKAVAICESLDSEKYSLEEKALAIQKVMSMPTHMGVKKDTLIGMIKWLWNFNLEVSDSHNGKHIVEIPTPHGDLIDRDDLLAYFDRKSKGKTAEEALRLLYTALKAYPTVIEKEMN